MSTIASNPNELARDMSHCEEWQKRKSTLVGVEEKPLRILHVHSGNLYGGVEATLAAQIRHKYLCPAIEQSFALCFEGRFSGEVAELGAEVTLLGGVQIRNPLSVRRARRRLKSLLEQQRFDIVVTHSSWSQAIFGTVVRAAGLPLVFWLHGHANGRHWLERWASKTSPDLALCNSHFTAGSLKNIYPTSRSEVVYCPLVASDISLLPNERLKIRTELGAAEDTVVIVQASRMEEWKGHVNHIKALGQLGDMPGWMCWIIGGAQRPEEKRYLIRLKTLAVELGITERVRFLGERSDVTRLLAASDIYCQPNTAPEPFGLTFIEALWAGVPVVTSNIGGAKEIVDESCGLLVQPANTQALSAALAKLIQYPLLRSQQGSAGPARALSLCGMSTQLTLLHANYSDLYRSKRWD